MSPKAQISQFSHSSLEKTFFSTHVIGFWIPVGITWRVTLLLSSIIFRILCLTFVIYILISKILVLEYSSLSLSSAGKCQIFSLDLKLLFFCEFLVKKKKKNWCYGWCQAIPNTALYILQRHFWQTLSQILCEEPSQLLPHVGKKKPFHCLQMDF